MKLSFIVLIKNLCKLDLILLIPEVFILKIDIKINENSVSINKISTDVAGKAINKAKIIKIRAIASTNPNIKLLTTSIHLTDSSLVKLIRLPRGFLVKKLYFLSNIILKTFFSISLSIE